MVKDKKTETIKKKKSVPLITEKRLQANRELLIGQKIKRFFPGHGGAHGTVKKYSVSNDTYYLTSAHWWSSRVNAFSWYTSSLSDNLTKLMINGNTWKWSRSKLCLVVRVWLILVGSNWYKTGIFERYYARIVVKGYLRKDDFDLLSFERMISTFWASKGWFRTFWALYPDFLSCCCSASFSTHSYPWILRVWLRYSVCLLSVLLYQYRNESAWKAIPGYPLKDDECLELQYAIYDLKQLTRASYFFRQEMHTQIGLTQS